MPKYKVILHTPWRGNSVVDRTFSSKEAAKKFGRALARKTDITANAAVFPVNNPSDEEWLF